MQNLSFKYSSPLHFVSLSIFILTILISCSSVPENKEQNIYDKSKLVKMSPQTKMFLDNLELEFKNFNKSDNFIPSEKLIRKYPIVQINNNYYVSGLIKTQEFTDDVDFSDLLINTKAGNILTVNIPLNNFFVIVTNDKIKYIQIDEKILKY